MRFSSIPTFALVCASAVHAQFTWERLDKTKAVVVIVDIQEGLRNVVRDFDPVTYRNSILAHAEFSNMFDLPLLITTASETGKSLDKWNRLQEYALTVTRLQRTTRTRVPRVSPQCHCGPSRRRDQRL